MARKPETLFSEKVQEDLKKLPNTWFTKIQQRARRGTPDILACVNGSFVALELKRNEQQEPDPLQLHTLKKIGNAKGASFTTCPENWPAVFELIYNLAHEGNIH